MELKKLIKRHEGLRLFPYKCSAGKTTIGYGRNLEDRGISEREAEVLLDADLAIAKQNLYEVFGSKIDNFSEKRHAALVDMIFNLGLPRFKGFKKMIEAIKNDNWFLAAQESLRSKWADQVGHRAVEDAFYLRSGE